MLTKFLIRADSYIGMDQQQDMKLDVKEAAAVPAEHPQWDLSDSDTDNNDQVSSYSVLLICLTKAALTIDSNNGSGN